MKALPKKYTFLIKAFLSLFGIGFIPFIPGSLASALTTAGWIFFLPYLSSHITVLIPLTFLIFIISFVSTVLIQKFLIRPVDKSWIVIDELVGMLVSLTPTIFLSTPTMVIFAFVYFRLFDIIKPSFIKQIDALHTPASVVLDDLAAGILSAASVILTSLLLS